MNMDPEEDLWRAVIAVFRAKGHAISEAVDYANLLLAAQRRRGVEVVELAHEETRATGFRREERG
jgi:hypothetical protein